MRGYRRPGGDSVQAEEFALRSPVMFYVRSPLTVFLHQGVYRWIADPLGLSVTDAVGFCSAAAGGVFVATLFAISRHWLFLLFNLATPFMFIFLGHVEHYAWVNALLAVYFLAVKRHLERGIPLWPALVWLLLAAGFHMLAVFYAPSFLCLLVERERATRRWRWRPTRRQGEILLLVFIGWAGLILAGMYLLPAAGLNNGVERLVPLAMSETPSRYYFTFFSLDHLKMWLYFHWMSSPLGLAGLALLVWTIRERFEKFMLVAVACGLFWTWIWHPDMGRPDWDLFANLALPMNILVGLLLARLVQRLKRRGGEND
jgi:hypothetical protein